MLKNSLSRIRWVCKYGSREMTVEKPRLLQSWPAQGWNISRPSLQWSLRRPPWQLHEFGSKYDPRERADP